MTNHIKALLLTAKHVGYFGIVGADDSTPLSKLTTSQVEYLTGSVMSYIGCGHKPTMDKYDYYYNQNRSK